MTNDTFEMSKQKIACFLIFSYPLLPSCCITYMTCPNMFDRLVSTIKSFKGSRYNHPPTLVTHDISNIHRGSDHQKKSGPSIKLFPQYLLLFLKDALEP